MDRTNFEKIPPVFIKVDDKSKLVLAKVIDGKNRVNAAIETGNTPYLLAYVLTDELRSW